MSKIKFISVILCIVLLSGCAGLVAKKPNQVIVLPDEKIYTVPANQEIHMKLDGKDLTYAFPSDMKLVSSTVLVRQEMRLNEEMLNAVKAKEDANKKLTLWGSILAAIGAALGLFVSFKKWTPKITFGVK